MQKGLDKMNIDLLKLISVTLGMGGREGVSRGRWYMYNYGWFVLLYVRNKHNIVNNFPPIKNWIKTTNYFWWREWNMDSLLRRTLIIYFTCLCVAWLFFNKESIYVVVDFFQLQTHSYRKKVKITLKKEEIDHHFVMPFQILLPAKASLSFLCILLCLSMCHSFSIYWIQ